jgi:hypothetical protein
MDVSINGIELQDREFFAAIREKREPNSSVAQVLPCCQSSAGWGTDLVGSRAANADSPATLIARRHPFR